MVGIANLILYCGIVLFLKIHEKHNIINSIIVT